MFWLFLSNSFLITIGCYLMNKPLFIKSSNDGIQIILFLVVIFFYHIFYFKLYDFITKRNYHFFLSLFLMTVSLNVCFMLLGYFESAIHSFYIADFFYYYKCIGNSCIYLVVLNFTNLCFYTINVILKRGSFER